MKILGFMLIVFSVSAFGFFVSKRISDKLVNMKKNEEIVTILVSGTENNRQSFAELYDEILKICGEEKADEARRIAESGGIDIVYSEDPTDLLLGRALCVFGTCFANEQVRELDYYREKIRAEISSKEDSIKKNAALAKNFGVLFGLLFAVLLC